MIHFLFNKWLWDSLSRVELMFLLDTPEFHRSQYMQACFRSANVFGKKELRRRLLWIQKFIRLEFPVSRLSYIGMKSLCVNIKQMLVQSPHFPKFTGWRRHQRVAKGSPDSLSWKEQTLFNEPDLIVNEPLYLELLLVEDPSLFQGRAQILLKNPGQEETS